jgi:hypothetical protein
MGVYLTVSAVLLASFLNPRPVIFSFLLFGVLILAVQDRRLSWAIPLVFWIWASTHGSWLFGGVYVVLQAISTRHPRLILNLIPAGVAMMLTAHGWGVIEITSQFFANRGALSLIMEWAPTNFASVGYFPILLGALLLIVAARRDRVSANDLWILVPFLYASASSARSVPMAWLAFAPIFTLIGAGVGDPRPLRGGDGRKAYLNVGLGIAIILLPFVLQDTPRLDADHFPVAAAAHLGTGRVLHSDVTGGYLIYSAWPERRVLIDDRAELYGAFMKEFVDVRNAHDWRRFLDEFGLSEALLGRKEPIVEVLRLQGWRQTYADEHFVVLVRS